MELKKVSPECEPALSLINELSLVLARITGNSGRSSFSPESMDNPRSAFFVAFEGNEAVGCGAIREYSNEIAEIKRVYAKTQHCGTGTKILSGLEHDARSLGYQKLILETRRINKTAITFYKKHGYQICPNYGNYKDRPEAICFYKEI